MFKVFKESKEGKEVEKEVYFRLEEHAGGDILLIACDKEGNKLESGNILYMNTNGEFGLAKSVNPTIGLQLDEEGRIKLCAACEYCGDVH